MVQCVLKPPNFTTISSSCSTRHLTSLSNSTHRKAFLTSKNHNKGEFNVRSVASIPCLPINGDYLQKEFGGRGISFEEIDESWIAKLVLKNGSKASVMLPSGVITSYKVPVWHGGKVELLHTAVFEDADGGALIRGGVSPAFQVNNQTSWSHSNWAVHDISGNPEDSLQVELVSRDMENMVEFKYIVTLKEETLSSEFIVSSSNSSAIQLKGSITSHLTVSTPEATYAVGLEGSSFVETTPFFTKFSIIPEEDGGNKSGFGQILNQIVPKEIFPGFNGSSKTDKEEEKEEEMEFEEKSNNKQLNQEMSRIYTNAPRNFTIIDRGRRNSVVVRREGFEEVYMMSPGSGYDSYDKFSYVCVGQSALLKSIILKPGGVWRAAQHLHNPNL